jgi:hypothetical protein
MVMKKVIVILFVLLLAVSVLADAIIDYSVPTSVPLNQKVTATGLFDSNSARNGIKCSFYLWDSNGHNIYQATDQYTNNNGRFAMNGKTLTEPDFVRGQTYSLRTECGSAFESADFVVGQKQEAFNILGFAFYPQGGFLDLMYLRDNSVMLFFFFIILMVAIGLIILGIQNFL